MSDQLLAVPFHNETVVLVDHDGEPFVAMRPIVSNMGLSWHGQTEKLNEKFSSTVREIRTVAEDGKQREMTCLPLRKFPAWLYSINPNKVAPELRDKIIRYQNECDDVLWNYWTKGYAESPKVKKPNLTQQLSAHKVRLTLMEKLVQERNPDIRAAIHQQLDHVSKVLGLSTPDISRIGFSHVPEPIPALVAEFWDIYEDLDGDHTLNHAHDSRLIAVNLIQFGKACEASKIKIPHLVEYRRVLKLSVSPTFTGINTVHSVLNIRLNATGSRENPLPSSVKCWLFERELLAGGV